MNVNISLWYYIINNEHYIVLNGIQDTCVNQLSTIIEINVIQRTKKQTNLTAVYSFEGLADLCYLCTYSHNIIPFTDFRWQFATPRFHIISVVVGHHIFIECNHHVNSTPTTIILFTQKPFYNHYSCSSSKHDSSSLPPHFKIGLPFRSS